MMKIKTTKRYPETISARFLVFSIGFIGLSLPIILITGATLFQGCDLLQNSISSYYHTIMRNYFVGALSAISLALFAYNGYGPVDKITAKFSSVFALGVAFFPTNVKQPLTPCVNKMIDNPLVNTIHFISATLLFVLFAFFSLVIFRQYKAVPSRKKLNKLLIYKICGITIIICIVLIAAYFFIFEEIMPKLAYYRPVFFLETLALVSFSTSWLVKATDIPKGVN